MLLTSQPKAEESQLETASLRIFQATPFILVEDSQFWIDLAPDGTLADKDIQRTCGGCGENAIDIKATYHDNSVNIRGCEIFHFRYRSGTNSDNQLRPQVDPLVIHMDAQNIVVDGCYFHDNLGGPAVHRQAKGITIQRC